MDKRVVSDSNLRDFYKRRATRRLKKYLGMSFPFFGKHRGRMLIDNDKYPASVQLYMMLRFDDKSYRIDTLAK